MSVIIAGVLTGGNGMAKNSDQFSMQEAMRLAQSETGKQLIALLRAQNSNVIDQAMTQVAAGDYGQAKQTLSSLLASPQVKSMLEQMGRHLNE
jgi:hypothetical protein